MPESTPARRPHPRHGETHRPRAHRSRSREQRQAAAVLLLGRRALAVILLALSAWGLALFPLANLPLLAGLAAYVVLLWWRPSAWLLVLPALIAGLDLTPYSGRLLWNEFNLFLLATVAMGLWHREPWRFSTDLGTTGTRLLGLLVVTQALFTLRGLWPLPPLDADAFASYLNPYNGLRMAKGFVFALLLLPMLQQVRARGHSIGRHLAIGLIAGLALTLVTVLWERLGFTGLLNFHTQYRITGLFSGMHNGGASIDAFMAMSAAFLPALFLFWQQYRFKLLGLLLGAGAVYALVVTFTRSDYLAAGLMGLVLIAGLWRFRRITHHLARKPLSKTAWILVGVAGTLFVGALAMGLRGGFLSERLATSGEDLQIRLKQWSTSAAIMRDDPITTLIGMGKGAFPRTRLWHDVNNGEIPGTFQLQYDLDGSAFLRLGRSEADNTGLSIRQRIAPGGDGTYRLQMRLRTPETGKTRVLVEFCERNILLPNVDCRWVGINVGAGENQWETYNTSVDLKGLGRWHWWGRKPVEISILNRGLTGTLDIDEVRLLNPDGVNVLANADFEAGMDHWLHAFENHLAWHIKNILYDAWFEGGLVGLATLLVVLGFTARRLVARVNGGDTLALLVAAALAAVFVVGLFDSLFDDPRIGLLFYLLLWTAWLPPEPDLDAREVMAWDGRAGWLEHRLGAFHRQPLPLRLGAIGALLILMGAAAVLYVMRSQQLDHTQMLLRLAQLAGVENETVVGALLPDPKYADHVMDGTVRALHPRILLPELAGWDGRSVPDLIAHRRTLWKEQEIPAFDHCLSGDLVANVTCWLGDGTGRRGRFLLGNALKLKIVPPSAGGNQYGNAWQLAIAADFLPMEPDYTPAQHATLQERLSRALEDYLVLLDGNSLSAWHGRLTMASNAWIVATALDADSAHKQDLVRRAQAHFLQSVRAVAYAEAWPEGFNYWINSRGYTFALAVAAYVNGLQDARHASWVRNALERVGLWMVYATRPDNRAAELADEGPRVDLKDETRRVVDIIAGVTRNPVFPTYSRYLARLHRYESYYRGYRGSFQLLNDPTVAPYADVKWGELAGLKWHLPTSELFGPGSMNLAYIRGGWAPEDTFISFRAGATMTHHAHYDAGHFTLFKGAPLALTSGTYGDFFAPHRLNYTIRTVAKNSLLILRPNEVVKPHPRFETNVADGGQRLVIPTGSAIGGVDDFKANLHDGLHFEGGEILAFSHVRDAYTYVAANLTGAYNNPRHDEMDAGGKVESVRRELLYLQEEDRLLIHDRVLSTQAEFLQKWLLHSASKPQVDGTTVLAGRADNGILESRADTAIIHNQDAHLDVQRLLPADAVMRVVGGEDYRFYVETDGDEKTLDGRNEAQGVREAKWFDTGAWRIELQPGTPRRDARFLVSLRPRLDARSSTPVQSITSGDPEAPVIVTDTAVIAFIGRNARSPLRFDAPGERATLYLAGLPDGARVSLDGQPATIRTSPSLGRVALDSGHRVEVSWPTPRENLAGR